MSGFTRAMDALGFATLALGILCFFVWSWHTARWPFEGASPLRVSASNGSPTGATIKADATGDYSYGIRFDCKANGASDPIDVDPDIIISGGTTTDSTVSKQS